MARKTKAVAITQSIQNFLMLIKDVLSKFRNLSEHYYILEATHQTQASSKSSQQKEFCEVIE